MSDAGVLQPDAAAMSGGRASRRVLAAVLLVLALSAAVRFVDLGRVTKTIYDEHYYVHDARVILHGDLKGTAAQPWKPAAELSAAHPDLAKLAIAAGIAVVGDGPWGWRAPAALAGLALIALVYPLARRMGLTPEWALAALILAASDPMLMLESRIAVLDIFVGLGTVLAVYLALRYVQSGFRARWVAACGIALGAAVACKWSGALAAPVVLVIVAPPLVRRSRPGQWGVALASLLVLPLLVYLAASIPYFAAGHPLADWLRLQSYMATFGWNVQGHVAFASAPPTWPFDVHPIWYSWSLGPSGLTGLLAIGNFLLWWTGVACWVVLGVLALLRRDWRLGLAPAVVGLLYLPWLLTTRQSYIYYMVPVIPFVAILVATGLGRFAGAPWARNGPGPDSGTAPTPAPEAPSLRRRRTAAWAACLAIATAGALFVPFVLGAPVPYEYYSHLMFFTTWR